MTVSIPRSILVATDLTPACDAAVATAGRLAAASGAALHAIHVHDFSAGVPGPLPSDDFHGRLASADRALQAQLRRTLPAEVAPASATVVIYSVARAVADHARHVAADLVVLGARRSRGVLDSFRRSTAEKVLRHAGRPCLVVPRALRLPLRRLLVGVDPSEAARSAVRVAVGWGGRLGLDPAAGERAEVHLVHVAEGRAGAAHAGHLRPVMDSARWDEGAQGVRIRGEVVRGADPSARLAELAASREACLVVVGARCRDPLTRALAGSVSAGVLRGAEAPVLLVPHDAAGVLVPAIRRTRADALRSRPMAMG